MDLTFPEYMPSLKAMLVKNFTSRAMTKLLIPQKSPQHLIAKFNIQILQKFLSNI